MTRLGDKLLYGLVMMSLFWGEGRKRRQMEAAVDLTATDDEAEQSLSLSAAESSGGGVQ